MRSFTGILSGVLLVLAARVAAQASPRGLSDAALPIYARKPSCPVGQYDHGNGCITCPAGYMCPGGTASAEQCSTGTYAAGGASSCTACPSGQYASQPGSPSCTPAQCGYAATGAQPGNGIGATGQTACGPGSFSAAGASSCMTCTAGSYCSSSTTCAPQQCQPGTYSPSTGASSCTACPHGTFINDYGATSCCSCCAGSFNSATSQTYCQACPAMTGPNGQGSVLVTSDVGSTSSTQCRAYQAGDPAPIPSACVSSSATLNQPTCPATTGPQPSGYRKRNLPRGCTVAGHTRCEVTSGRGGWECIDTNTTLDACGSCNNDCSAIPYVGGVSCVAGKCQVSSCQKGFKVQSVDGKPACVPTTKHGYMLFEANMGLLH